MPAKMSDDMPLESAADASAVITSSTDRKGLRQEDVVITGVAGRLPESDNVEEFRQNLMNGVDMVTADDRRWPPGLHGLPTRNGKLKDISRFDASFFGVHPKQAHAMDPQLRMLLEVVHEAIADAGVEPSTTRGSRTGVFIGCSASEAHEAWSNDIEEIVGYEMTGCTRSMFANRLSFFFDFKGPSYATDTACSSSLLALDQALHSIRAGQCDAAIVGGCSLCLKPSTSLQFQRLGMLSPEGTCKSFDASGNGYCRSEAVCAIYLQKESAAKRIYATIVHTKTNSDGNKAEGITFPSGPVQKALLHEVYSEAGVNPADVAYVECHGTGTAAGDPQELNTITDVFCAGRQGPLLIGSTKSNMGHPEPASGLAALTKVLIAMEDGVIPSNLHFKSPNLNIPGLVDGRLKVVAENQPWEGGYVSINSFGFGGSNVHALLKSHSVKKTAPHAADEATRLVTYAGRTEEAVKHVLEAVQQSALTMEAQTLLQAQALAPPAAMPFRGYTLLNTEDKSVTVEKCPNEQRPTWFVFAGMGTQWPAMGRNMMTIVPFSQSISRSDAVLAPYGLNLYDTIMKGEDVSDSILLSFVGIAAIQVALTDVLTSLGIRPDGIIGHSVGELGCAYADGGLTAEETVLAAYWRGRCVKEANLPAGAMAAVGLTWAEAKERCPKGIVPACHNSEDTVTISGPAEDVRTFVAQLKEEDIFAKEVNSAGVAFHSYFMERTAPALKAALKKVIKERRLRSPRWVSSSLPESRWSEDLAKYSCPEYHVNNLLSPVLFQEALQHVPSNAIVIEIAPHCLLQAILKRSLATTCTFAGLMKRNHVNNVEFCLNSLAKCYAFGLNFNPLDLHASVSLPVPKGTPMVAPLIRWDHDQTWNVPTLEQFTVGSGGTSACVFKVEMSADSADQYLVGHCIDGRVLYPATGYLVLAWRALARIEGRMFEEMPVVFDDVQIHRATILPKSGTVVFEVNIMPVSGEFEVCESGAKVVSGRVTSPTESILQLPAASHSTPADANLIPLGASDIYKELRLRGYDYGPTFQGILDASNHGEDGHLLWNGNWVSYLDAMLQIQVLSLPGRSLRLPTRIKALRIDPAKQQELAIEIDSQRKATKVVVDRVLDTCMAGGVEILGLHATVAPRRQNTQAAPTLEAFKFIPYMQNSEVKPSKSVSCYMEATLGLIKDSFGPLLDGTNGAIPNSALLKKIVQTIEKSTTTEEVARYETMPGCGILQTLKQITELDIAENFSENVTNIIQTNKDEILKDCLKKTPKMLEALKTFGDVVLENQGARLKVVEINADNSKTFQGIISNLTGQPMVNVDYTAVTNQQGLVSEETLDNMDMKSAVWNLNGAAPGSITSADLVVVSDSLHLQQDLPEALGQLSTLLKEDGFLLIQEPTCNFPVHMCLKLTEDFTSFQGRTMGPFLDEASWQKIISDNGFSVVAKNSDGVLTTSFLCRKSTPKIQPIIISVDDPTFSWVEEVKKSLQEIDEKSLEHTMWLVSKNPCNGVIGMVNCLRQETGGQHLRCVYINGADKDIKEVNMESDAFKQILNKDLAMNIYENGQWGSYRHIPSQQVNLVEAQHAYVNVLTRGDLASLKWIESPLKYFCPQDHPTKELCTVSYTSLNFRDIMLATGKLPPDAIPGDLAHQDCLLGMEFSGYTSKGKRTMGLLPAKGLATTVDADARFLWDVPEAWTLEEAASVPVVYTTAYYALVERGRIRKGDKVLIHSGSGGVGQAAIAVALHYGCEVFTTVGSQAKREYLMSKFPQLKDRNFSNSRDLSFEWDILRATNGKGVDVVLNSLAEEKLQASLRVLAPHGRFLEIGKFDLANNTGLGMALFLKNITFHGILLDALFEEGNADWQGVADLLTKGIAEGAVHPLKTTVFDKDDVEDAFRFMAQGKHIGKVLVKICGEANPLKTKPTTVSALPRTACNPSKSYLLVGGLGGFGMELTHWLVERGARKIMLTSRSGVKTGYQSRCIRMWRETGIDVKVSTKNVQTKAEAEALISETKKMGPIGGVFNLAMVLRDGLMENQDQQQFQQVADPKVTGTFNLDAVTRPENLDWFVVFSSVSCGRGNAGQANYGFANSVMERICEARQAAGHSGLAVQWGAIGDVGVVLDTMGGNEAVIGGTLPQRILSCLDTLDKFLQQTHPVMSSFVLAERKRKNKSDKGDKPDLVDAVSHILGIKDPSSVNQDQSLADIGLDSLMGVEVKQTLERDHDLVLGMKEIRALTINQLRSIGSGSAEAADQSSSSLNDSGVSLRYDLTQLVPSDTITQMKEGRGPASFLIHPIEGSVISLETLAAHLDGPVYGVQCTADAPLASIEELATSYLQEVRRVQPDGPYRIAGYSFGACVAVEMAQQLEAAQQKVAISLLDGSHNFVAAHTSQYQAKNAGESQQVMAETEAMIAFAMQFTTIDYRKVSQELISRPDFKSRVQHMTEVLVTALPHLNTTDVAAAVESFYHKLIIADKYKPTSKLSTDVTLIKATEKHKEAGSLGKDYGLSQVCTGIVHIHEVSGDHESFIQGESAEKVAALMNAAVAK